MANADQYMRKYNGSVWKTIVSGVAILLIAAFVTGGFRMYSEFQSMKEAREDLEERFDRHVAETNRRFSNHSDRLSELEQYLYRQPHNN